MDKVKKLKKEDYVLYLLNHLSPDQSDLMKLNKIAFLVEFAYLYHKEQPLSDVEYAAITYGTVIDDYKGLLKEMEKKKLIDVDGYNIRVITSKKVDLPEDLATFIDARIAKYAGMTNAELRAITHDTDSYLITSKNGKEFGNRIKKSLATLETFFDDNESESPLMEEKALPKLDKSQLVPYEFWWHLLNLYKQEIYEKC